MDYRSLRVDPKRLVQKTVVQKHDGETISPDSLDLQCLKDRYLWDHSKGGVPLPGANYDNDDTPERRYGEN